MFNECQNRIFDGYNPPFCVGGWKFLRILKRTTDIFDPEHDWVTRLHKGFDKLDNSPAQMLGSFLE